MKFTVCLKLLITSAVEFPTVIPVKYIPMNDGEGILA